jgi:hypothetical protein
METSARGPYGCARAVCISTMAAFHAKSRTASTILRVCHGVMLASRNSAEGIGVTICSTVMNVGDEHAVDAPTKWCKVLQQACKIIADAG